MYESIHIYISMMILVCVLYVHVHVCVCKFSFTCCVCMSMHVCASGVFLCWLHLFFWDKSLTEPIQIDPLASKCQRSFVLRATITTVWCWTQHFTWILGTPLGSSCLHSKLFTNCIIAPPPPPHAVTAHIRCCNSHSTQPSRRTVTVLRVEQTWSRVGEKKTWEKSGKSSSS